MADGFSWEDAVGPSSLSVAAPFSFEEAIPKSSPPAPKATFQDVTMSEVPFAKDIAAGADALMDTAVNAYQGKNGPSFSDAWQQHRDENKAAVAAYLKDHPITGRIAEGLGLMSSMGAAPEAAATAVPSLAQRVATGAGTGAVYGLGTSDGDLDDRAKGTAAGAVSGAALSAASPLINKGLGWLGDQASALAKPFTDEGRKDIAGQALLDIAGGKVPDFAKSPLPGMQPTAAQASANPGLIWQERAAQQASPEARTMAENARTANNTAIHDAIGQLAGTTPGDQAPSVMLQRLEAARDTARQSVRNAWKAANLDDSAPIDSAPLKSAVTDYLTNLAPIERTQIPAAWLTSVEDLGENTNLKELQAFRAYIGDAERGAYRSGNNNQARILGGLSDIMETHTEEPEFISMQDPDAYQAARGATREFKQTFNQPAAVRNALGVDRYGADKIPESAIADTFIRSGKGAPEALQSYLSAVKDDPEALDAARSAFAAKFLDTIENAGVDENGNKLISAAKLPKFLDDYDHVVNSPLFTPAQRDLMSKIADASEMASRTARGAPPGGGSDTAAKLYGNRFIDALIGKWPAQVLTTAAGAATGSLSGLPGAAVTGAVVGRAAGDRLVQALYSAPQQRVVSILNEALHDPSIARALMMRASNSAANGMSPAARSFLWSVLAPTAGRVGRWVSGQGSEQRRRGNTETRIEP